MLLISCRVRIVSYLVMIHSLKAKLSGMVNGFDF